MTPFKCPACDGYGKRERKPGGKRKKCRACQGLCVVWSLDTYRPAPYYWHRPYYLDPFYSTGGVVFCSNAYTTSVADVDITTSTYTDATSIMDAGAYTTDLSTASWTVS